MTASWTMATKWQSFLKGWLPYCKIQTLNGWMDGWMDGWIKRCPVQMKACFMDKVVMIRMQKFCVKRWSVLGDSEWVSSRAVCGSKSSSAGPQGWWFLECKIDTGFILKEWVHFHTVYEETLICPPTHLLLYSRSNFLHLFCAYFCSVSLFWKWENCVQARKQILEFKALWWLENLILNQFPWSSSI